MPSLATSAVIGEPLLHRGHPRLKTAFDPLARKASQIVENDDRVGFTPLERAAAYQELLTPRR